MRLGRRETKKVRTERNERGWDGDELKRMNREKLWSLKLRKLVRRN